MPPLSKRALIGNVGAIFMLAFFTALWAFFIPWGFGWNLFSIAGLVIFVLIAVWIYTEAIKTIRAVRKLPDTPTIETDKRTAKNFGIVFGTEIILIMVSFIIFGNSIVGNPDYITPVIAVIVGAHCIPLGVFFHTRILAVVHFARFRQFLHVLKIENLRRLCYNSAYNSCFMWAVKPAPEKLCFIELSFRKESSYGICRNNCRER
ncbi:MAG: hypothetical protein LBI03_08970 [Clostridiales bacterium]|jgi:glycosyltransferase involved in cell wall biosynthesis|nr:hypothetical protein [Clostridiales bacterium]